MIHDEWMHSPGHRTNLLNPEVDRVGVAVVASRGVLYAVADYSRAVQSLAAPQVEARVAALIRAERSRRFSAIRRWRVPPAQPTRECPVRSAGMRPGFIMRWQDADLDAPAPGAGGSARLRAVSPRRRGQLPGAGASKAPSRLIAWRCCCIDSA